MMMLSSGIAYEDIGVGAAVVFLHGFALDRTMWAPQTSALSTHYRCISVDIRGSGDSPAVPPYAMDALADDIAGVLDTCAVERATVVGLSMGGYISFALWRRHRARVRALVLADTRAGPDAVEGLERRRQLIEVARSQGSAAVAKLQVSGLLGKTTRARHPDIIAFVSGMMTRMRIDGIVGQLEAMMSRPDSTPMLPTIDVPVMAVVGDEDVITPPKEARTLHGAIRGSRLEIIAQAGHLSSLERPAAFNTVLVEFLSALAAD